MAAASPALDRSQELADAVTKNHQKWIHAIGKLTGQYELAEDLVQSGLLLAVRFLPSFRGESALSSWVYRIIINAARGEFRKPKYRFIEVEINEYAATVDGAREAERKRLFNQTVAFVNRLPTAERNAVRNFYLLDIRSESPTQKIRRWRGIQRLKKKTQ